MNEKSMQKIKNCERRKDLYLQYSVSKKYSGKYQKTEENLKLMQDALATLGVRLNIKDGEISPSDAHIKFCRW